MLKKLCTLRGISGREKEVANFIIDQIKDNSTYKVDNIGNIIAFKKGSNTPLKPIMVAAHMDEVGMIVKYISNDGYISFETVGGIDSKVLPGIHVLLGDNKIKGVIGAKAIHLLSKDERSKPVKADDLSIDIGVTSKEEAQKYVSIGDMITFDSEFSVMGDKVCCKAIDDRIGCKIMIDLINSELEYDTTFAFTVQEEVGLRGATVASYDVNPHYAIVIDATTASDINGVSDEKHICKVDSGAVVSFMDKATIYNNDMFKLTIDTAIENNIKYQVKKGVTGGNDGGAIHKSRGGVKTIAICLPCRYLHSPSCMIDSKDEAHVFNLIKSVIGKLGKSDF